MMIKWMLKRDEFSMEPRVFTQNLLLLKSIEDHLVNYHKMIYPKSNTKIDTKNHRKTILIL